jgi:hypothetical protein
MRQKRDSRRRWKARYRLGRWVPFHAIFNHRLQRDCYRVAKVK